MKAMDVVAAFVVLLAGLSAAEAERIAESVYKNEQGLVARIVQVGESTAFCLELDKERCKGYHVVATVRGPGDNPHDVPVFILCEGEPNSERDYPGPLRFVIPNARLDDWGIRIEFYKVSHENDLRLLKLASKKEETLRQVTHDATPAKE